MLFSFGSVKSNAEFHCAVLYWMMFFYIVLCSSVLDYVRLYRIMLFCIRLCSSVSYYAFLYWSMSSYIVLCFSVLNYGKVNYAYVISFMALTEQNLDD